MSLGQVVQGIGGLLTALVFGVWIVRRVQSHRASAIARDEVAFERQYQQIEPESDRQRSLDTIGSMIVRLHQGWALLTVPFLVVAAAVAFRSDRLVRLIIAATLAIMMMIVVAWVLLRHFSRITDATKSTSVDPR